MRRQARAMTGVTLWLASLALISVAGLAAEVIHHAALVALVTAAARSGVLPLYRSDQ